MKINRRDFIKNVWFLSISWIFWIKIKNILWKEINEINEINKKEITIFDRLLLANFSSWIYNISKWKKSWEDLFWKLRIYNKFINKIIKNDKHYPHAELYTWILLNALYWLNWNKEKVLHWIEESLIWAWMITWLTILWKSFEPKLDFEKLKIEQETYIDLKELKESKNFKKDVELIENQIWKLIGLKIVWASLTQFPKTSYWNANKTWLIMRKILELVEELWNELKNKPVEEIIDEIEDLENESIKESILSIIKKYRKEEYFNDIMVNEFIKNYSNKINIWLLSWSIDIWQAAIWDIWPALVWAYQSFWLKETIKTSIVNLAFSIIWTIIETIFISKRSWIKLSKFFNKENLNEMLNYVFNTYINFLKILMIKEQNSNWSNINIWNIKTDIKNIINSLIFNWNNGWKDRIINNILNAIQNEIDTNKFEIENLLKINNETLNNEEINRLSRLATILSHEIEYLLTNNINYSNDIQIIDENLEKLLKIKDKVDSISKDLIIWINQIYEKVKNEPDINPNFLEKFEQINEIINKDMWIKNLINFDYWKDNVWSEIAESFFVVLFQWIHWVWLLPIFSNFMNNNDFEIYVKYILFSMFADNWLAQLTSAKELAKTKINEIQKKLWISWFEYNETKNVKDNFDDFKNFLNKNDKLKPEIEEIINDIFITIKSLSIIAWVVWWWETTIWNAPHFSAITWKLKNYISLNETLNDIKDNLPQHIIRIIYWYIRWKYIAPKIEKNLSSI